MYALSLWASEFHRMGFFGQEGPLWVFLGFVCWCIIIAILFKILKLALPAFGVTEPWIQIIYWVAVLILFILFLNFAFGFGWA